MPRNFPESPLKTLLVALACAAMFCAGCAEEGGPAEAVAEQDEIQKWLAENPDADVDMEFEDEDVIDE